ncbi:MAG TPA: inositol monophosphatase family protein [Micromonosporaceae bacterium]|nr:inositol monophosphatase family protein [Micromonosporaceae bacterium]
MVSPAELLEVARAVVAPAAGLAREMRAGGVRGLATKSTDTDVVTAADRAVERQVVEALAAVRPGDTLLGEEYGDAALGTQADDADPAEAVRWILDPIDGTVNYLYGLPQYSVSLAAEVRGVVVAGVVRNAATGDEWTATRGGGAFRAGRRLSCSTETRLGQALVATGFGYDPARRRHQAEVLTGLLAHVRDIRRFGVASLDLCLAAEGMVDAYYEKGLNPWDHAAGGLVATEAGLVVTGLAGAPPGLDLVLAAPPALHPALHDHLVRLDAAGGP